MADDRWGTLELWGWDEHWASLVAARSPGPGVPARVVAQHRDRWTVQMPSGGASARLTSSTRIEPYPVVGDWVLAEPGPALSDPCSLIAVLPRRSSVLRGGAGGVGEQALAANVDDIWITHALDTPLNARRIERYLALAWESGARPEIILTKADLAEDAGQAAAELQRIAFGATVRTVSAEDGPSVVSLRESLRSGATVALLGPSGTGKSTLINALADADLATTGAVREGDRKGRHTTTHRELFRVPGGALVIDTPGLRELRVLELDAGLALAFPDIDELAASCRFRDCTHETEPDCAVLEAVADGHLDAERLESFRKLRAEAAYQATRTDAQARRRAVAEHKTAMKTLKHHMKFRDPNRE